MQRGRGMRRRRRAVMAERRPHRATASSRNQGAGHVTGLREEKKDDKIKWEKHAAHRKRPVTAERRRGG
jgi:hypothetical protein